MSLRGIPWIGDVQEAFLPNSCTRIVRHLYRGLFLKRRIYGDPWAWYSTDAIARLWKLGVSVEASIKLSSGGVYRDYVLSDDFSRSLLQEDYTLVSDKQASLHYWTSSRLDSSIIGNVESTLVLANKGVRNFRALDMRLWKKALLADQVKNETLVATVVLLDDPVFIYPNRYIEIPQLNFFGKPDGENARSLAYRLAEHSQKEFLQSAELFDWRGRHLACTKV